jgi:hypothetical protein
MARFHQRRREDRLSRTQWRTAKRWSARRTRLQARAQCRARLQGGRTGA